MKRFVASLLLLSFALQANAIGTFKLKGSLKGFTETTYIVVADQIEYEIKKAGLNPQQLKDLKAKHSGDRVEMMLTTDDVKSAVDKSLKK